MAEEKCVLNDYAYLTVYTHNTSIDIQYGKDRIKKLINRTTKHFIILILNLYKVCKYSKLIQ